MDLGLFTPNTWLEAGKTMRNYSCLPVFFSVILWQKTAEQLRFNKLISHKDTQRSFSGDLDSFGSLCACLRNLRMKLFCFCKDCALNRIQRQENAHKKNNDSTHLFHLHYLVSSYQFLPLCTIAIFERIQGERAQWHLVVDESG